MKFRALQAIDEDLRQGNLARAVTSLRKLETGRLARKDKAFAANLFRRADLPDRGLRLLGPVVLPQRGKTVDPTAYEVTIYAGNLLKVGAVEQAMRILDLAREEIPEVLLFRAHAYMSQWDYRSTIPVLENYLAHPKIDGRQQLIGWTNLAAALIHESQWRPAQALLVKLRDEATRQGENVLLANSLELSAQLMVQMKRWPEAIEFIETGRRHLPPGWGVDSFLLEKWRTVIELHQIKDGNARRARLNRMREEAIRFRHRETLRYADSLEAILERDVDLLWRVYFGTPYFFFRAKLLLDFGDVPPIPDEYFWTLGKTGRTIDLFDGEWKSSKWAWHSGSTLFRLSQALVSDFYRPLRIATLHELVYPGDYFNPDSSPVRLRQAMRGLRSFFELNQIPLAIEWNELGYRLTATRGGRLRLVKPRISSEVELSNERLAPPFTSHDVCRIYSISRKAAHRKIRTALETGQIEKKGAGRATAYLFRGRG